MHPLQTLKLKKNGWVPNNERLPVLIYTEAIPKTTPDKTRLFEKLLKKNGWPVQWQNGVYNYHHYHSTAHEVLACSSGSASLILGGEGGKELAVETGDLLVLPTGTGHYCHTASSDFLILGAYPPDQQWDICRAEPSAEALQRMQSLPFPHSDPVYGGNGPLLQFWLGS